MGVVLDDSPGQRVLLYGADGSTLLKVVVDASGHLQVDVLSVLDAAARLYGYDGAAWANLLVESAASPNLRVGLWDGARRALVWDRGLDAGSVDDQTLVVSASLLGFNGSTWDRVRTFDTGILQVAQSFTDAFAQSAEGIYATHVKTTRWTYTVPAGRRAILDYVCCRANSTTAVGNGISGIDFTPSGGSARTLYFLESNTTDRRAVMVHVECYAEAGDVFTGWTILADATSRWLAVNAWFRELTL